MTRECWDFRSHIEVPGFNIHVECKCGRKFVTADDTKFCGEPIT